jgi:hypothetical protein
VLVVASLPSASIRHGTGSMPWVCRRYITRSDDVSIAYQGIMGMHRSETLCVVGRITVDRSRLISGKR